MSETTTVTTPELEALITAALAASDTSEPNARSVARALTQAEIDGQKGHGLSRVPSYAAQAKTGKVDGHATPVLRRTRPGSLMIDVANGFAFPAFDLAIDRLPALAAACGIAAAGFVRSHHFGVVGRHVERLAETGLVALAFGNTPKAMAPWGGRRALFGTNPVAFAAPQGSGPPVVVDLALSQVARGKILTAAQKGEPIPADWAVDESGRPTTDAAAALKGALQPIGGAKGAALALMVEILAVALTGAQFGFEASSFFDAEGPPPGVGQLLLVLDPGAFAGRDAFAERMTLLVAMIEGDGGARLPGSRRIALRAKARSEGVTVDAGLLAEVRALAAS
ncbi:MAG TPA: Ldh family oxidoreductase [Hyphomicrobiaceae bacterium]|nr:Ldh family oxidoreductase [Hyphomicrobiaceae bacterium]